ncbi:F0F1 ATP synthase subunit delta [Nitrincola alkalilacustris]|uniref:F0F1 ATP synthase subunit delta n=1 Tax=Nitrincola alkalilacustris TaxID=1571224 RepID=UPI00124BFB39|nr:F0F1 ATP synthase subunit delta [Nitrincola alkalilacustris]
MAELNTVARPYTKAAFEFALSKDALEQWSDMLAAASLVVKDSEMVRVLGSLSLTWKQKAELLISVCEKQMDDARSNFIYLLAEKQRLPLLPEIALQFAQLKANHEKSVDITITTAFALEDAQQEQLVQALRSRLGREVKMTSTVDQSIIGGVVIRSNDLVIDGSVRARLAKLAEAMNS